ncbi:monosaccharide ABC transporter ATP-binding protein (CUT2 family) [Herbihabitans rhizosphaerae]|uniref:Monosaccharide ABC transporter ATP-binding protein (CUT2 family) n=1 Tax=Herbihabitans rhizosphaerae TaxID=1872711 RepID=A0A4Q7L3I0_9PSEU|nr:sugar ABC transporter ATP-binding protein [Herbihabitans rhizosphaerae]RZS43290.1 monosaccharide ABC transporter ATP-binding protein (CUT2 family) [Herbihabitans rhizosphaerae]
MDDDVSPLVEMTSISKSYGGVQACRDIDFTVRAGEVHALLGENGAGKSTLMKVLSGEVVDHQGEIFIEGARIRFNRPIDAQRAGIAMIHQELDLVPALSIAENIFLGKELKTRAGTVDKRRMIRQTGELLERTGVALDPRRLVEELRTGEQQLVTIAKALSLDARVLIMDEPTSALSSHEVEQLFEVISELRASGVGMVYISHRMEEIGRVADRATVLRNGSVVAEFDARELTAAQASEAMVGRPVQTLFHTSTAATGDEVLVVNDLHVHPKHPSPGRRDPNGITLSVRAGEIVGLAGLLGAGRTELLETLYGIGSPGSWSGEVSLRGKRIRPRGARRALRMGMAFVPEDRRIAGLALEHSVLANTVLSIVDRLAVAGAVPRGRERDAAQRSVEELGVKLGSINDPVGSLSGGNQQKVVLGRGMLTDPVLLLLDEPTRGVDVGAKAEIYRLLGEAAKRGVGVLFASSELAELVGVCDRVIVLRDGRSVRELNTSEVGEADLLAASMGEGMVVDALANGEANGGEVA